MSKLQWRGLIYQFIGFGVLFFAARFLITEFTGLSGFWIPITAFVVGTILSPKFQAAKTRDGEHLYMSWLFVKGIKKIN